MTCKEDGIKSLDLNAFPQIHCKNAFALTPFVVCLDETTEEELYVDIRATCAIRNYFVSSRYKEASGVRQP